MRLKGLGIQPVLTIRHGASIAFYYEDPDHNVVELKLDNFGHWQQSGDDTRTSREPVT